MESANYDTPAEESPGRPSIGQALVIGLACLAVIVVFHSPRWWILAHRMPGSFEWDRGLEYLKQCQAPFRTDIEPGMRWRYFPQILLWALGGSSVVAIAFSWLGAWALVAYLYHRLCEYAPTRGTAILGTLLLGASAPVFVSTQWIGFNDAWMVFGLCYLAFGKKMPGLVAACVIGPFIDERFVFGIPLAMALRSLDGRSGAKSLGALVLRMGLALTPFVLGRVLGAMLGHEVKGDAAFTRQVVRGSSISFAMAPLGAWMALRFAYFPAAQGLATLYRKSPAHSALLLAAGFVPVCVGFTLASDTMRTAGILLPLCLWGVCGMMKRSLGGIWKALAWAALLVPAAHVTANKLSVINSLPVEILRLIRG